MSYTVLSYVATGDLATAALHNLLIDDLAVLKTSIDNNGHLNWLSQVKSGNFTLTTADDIIFFSATATATLPAAPATGKPYIVKAGSGATVTVSGNGKNIDGVATFTLNPYDSAAFIYNGTEYEIF